MAPTLRRVIMGGFAAGALATALAGAAPAETLGPVTDDVGVVKIAKGQPILIGALLVLLALAEVWAHGAALREETRGLV